MAYEISQGRCGSWAQYFEIASLVKQQENWEGEIQIEEGTVALIIAVTNPESDRFAPPEGFKLYLTDSEGQSVWEEQNTEKAYVKMVHGLPQFVIQIEPKAGRWKMALSSIGTQPYSVNLTAFKRRDNEKAPAIRRPDPGWNCTACKFALRALGLAIAAGTVVGSWPIALLSAVALCLHTTVAIATWFLNGLVGLSVGEIAERLCKQLRLC